MSPGQKASAGRKDSQSHDPHSQLFSQVMEWLHAEKAKLVHKSQPSIMPQGEQLTLSRRIEDGGQGALSTSSDKQLALEKLERILNDSMKVAQSLLRSPNKDSSYFARRKSSTKRLRRASLVGASSDTEYYDGDAIVPSTDAVLDNSKTMSYSGGTVDSDSEVSSTKTKAKEKEGWIVFKNEVLRLAHTLRLKGWGRIPLEQGRDLEISRLSGALTNAVYVVSPPKNLSNTPATDSSLSLVPRRPPSYVSRPTESEVLC